ncbi:glycosyltransferase family 4 protein [Methylovorus menthalis]|uniref:glycosyltransferase family 4 protein n=1 Tax=Methylovorus menthalis TaxID=1002227 RepID=UPI001E293C59|nr:glycosyltransferase family 4 protein [Methylovorus menthalis]MCB4810631.1 glycosyltransferase family 4 protein [Methylovorus menthalis]
MPERLFIHATNVHQGGGATLLLSLASALDKDVEVILCLDERMVFPDGSPHIQVKKIKPSVFQRLRAEWWLKKNVTQNDCVICLGNLPPLFRLLGDVTVFLQNRYLVEAVKLDHFPLKTKLRIMMERLWLRTRISNVDEFAVQTPSMKRLLQSMTATPIHMLPFVTQQEGYTRSIKTTAETPERNTAVFLYVASGEPHKNHRKLIEAWCLLAEQGIYPLLKLTLNQSTSPDLCRWIDEMTKRHSLNIENLGTLSHDRVLEHYRCVDALIYPSTFESFGLPLIEARQANLTILASELDYVRDVIDPEQSFDPESAISIAKAVKRFMTVQETPLPLQNASAFLKHVFERSRQSAHSHR